MDRRVWIIIALIYLIWPADLMPGVPIDDIVVLLVSAFAQMPVKRLEDNTPES